MSKHVLCYLLIVLLIKMGMISISEPLKLPSHWSVRQAAQLHYSACFIHLAYLLKLLCRFRTNLREWDLCGVNNHWIFIGAVISVALILRLIQLHVALMSTSASLDGVALLQKVQTIPWIQRTSWAVINKISTASTWSFFVQIDWLNNGAILKGKSSDERLKLQR